MLAYGKYIGRLAAIGDLWADGLLWAPNGPTTAVWFGKVTASAPAYIGD